MLYKTKQEEKEEIVIGQSVAYCPFCQHFIMSKEEIKLIKCPKCEYERMTQ